MSLAGRRRFWDWAGVHITPPGPCRDRRRRHRSTWSLPSAIARVMYAAGARRRRVDAGARGDREGCDRLGRQAHPRARARARLLGTWGQVKGQFKQCSYTMVELCVAIGPVVGPALWHKDVGTEAPTNLA
ncbi:MAG TPA: hypothetical protein VM099_16290 [Gemmatimonadaceae bacterium]|nr:hypothetical protein [Gemmatimonadaceae bacterium]